MRKVINAGEKLKDSKDWKLYRREKRVLLCFLIKII